MQETILYSVDDCKVFPITAIGDSATAPTYDTPVDVPGFQTIGLDPQFTEAELKGDGVVLDSRSALDSVTGTVEYAKIGLNVLPSIVGGAVTNNATGDGDNYRYVRKNTDAIPEFGLCALVSEVDNPGAQALIAVFRCRINGGTFFSAEQDDYGTPSFDWKGTGLPDDGSFFALDLDLTPGTPGVPASGAAFLALRDALT